MTNKEALIAVLQGLTVPDLSIEKALADQGVSGAATYASEGGKSIDLAAVEILKAGYTDPDISEGGYSISHPDFLRKIEARLLGLAKKHGLQDIIDQFVTPGPKVTGVRPW